MKSIAAIAWNTFKEAIRNRILYFILVFAIAMILLSGVVSELTIAARGKIIMDFGFSAINMFGVAIAVFLGVSLVYNELEKKTIYTIVSKPIARWQFLLGKYFGLLLTVYVNILVMSLFFLASVHYYASIGEGDRGFAASIGIGAWRAVLSFFWWGAYPISAHIMPVIFVTMLELAIITSFAVLFSSFSTPILSMMFTVMIFIAGRLNEDIVRFAVTLWDKAYEAALLQRTPVEEQLTPAYHFAVWAAHIVPNLGAFHVTVSQALYEDKVAIGAWTIVYGVLYTAGVLALAVAIFQRRNFK